MAPKSKGQQLWEAAELIDAAARKLSAQGYNEHDVDTIRVAISRIQELSQWALRSSMTSYGNFPGMRVALRDAHDQLRLSIGQLEGEVAALEREAPIVYSGVTTRILDHAKQLKTISFVPEPKNA